MRAYQITTFADAPSLVELPEPPCGPGEVRVRIRACSLNYRDLAMVSGRSIAEKHLPLIPLSDGAGEVIEVGDGVSRWRPGDRVSSIFMPDWLAGAPAKANQHRATGGTAPGTLTEHFVVSEEALVRVPEHLSFEEASTLACAAVTAWQGLVTRGGLTAGQTVLTLGTGGVSVFALQLAQLAGARTIITSSSDEKLERARRLGAWGTVNYAAREDWDRAVLELTDGVGVDHVVEVGGAGTLERSMNAAKVGGRIALIGVLAGFSHTVNPGPILRKNLDVAGVYVGSREMFEELNQALTVGQVHPVIDRVFPFEEAPAAYAHLRSGAHFGKVVIAV